MKYRKLIIGRDIAHEVKLGVQCHCYLDLMVDLAQLPLTFKLLSML